MEDAHVWFVRFAMDKQCRTLACGNRQGTVFVWDPQDMDRRPAAKLRREAPPAASRAHTTVRLLTHQLCAVNRVPDLYHLSAAIFRMPLLSHPQDILHRGMPFQTQSDGRTALYES